jgi:hypothetical protein
MSKRQLWWQQLDRNMSLESSIACTIDDTHAPASDLTVELVGGAERLLHVRAEFGVF